MSGQGRSPSLAVEPRGLGSPPDTAEAYRRCEAITRRQAANFFYGIRLLPRERRRAISAVYAFARRVDDIGDGTLPLPEKLELLEAQARRLEDAQRDRVAPADDAVLIALVDAGGRFTLPQDALVELIAGVRMDLEGTVYETFEELLLYCRRVAGGIGRVCLAIFGTRPGAEICPERSERLADELGVAMQLTNILRDMREDALNGRVYLPGAELRRFGLAADPPGLLGEIDAAGSSPGPAREALVALVRFQAERARGWFERGTALTEVLDRRSAASVVVMAGIYRRLLERIAADPPRAARGRVSLPPLEKALVAARGMVRGAS